MGRWMAAAGVTLAVAATAGATPVRQDAASDRAAFDAQDKTGNGFLTGSEVTDAARAYDANGDGAVSWEEFAAASAALDVATGSGAARVAKPTAPRPGHVVGRAAFADGRPVPRFEVTAAGWAGEAAIGARGTAPSLGMAAGADGRYALRTTSENDRNRAVRATVVAVQADALLSYGGRAYRVRMAPTDGRPDGPVPNGFRGDSGPGVVRDFVLRISGPKPGFERATPPREAERDEPGDPGYASFYGGTVKLVLYTLPNAAGSRLTVTLTPSGPLLDGSVGRTVVRTVSIPKEQISGYEFFFRDVPVGDYRASVVHFRADGTSVPLRVRASGGGTGADAPVVFAPFDVAGGFSRANLTAEP